MNEDYNYKKLIIIAFLLALAIMISFFFCILGDSSEYSVQSDSAWDKALDKALSRGEYSNQYVRDVPESPDGVKRYGDRNDRVSTSSGSLLDGYDLFGIDVVGSRFTPNLSNTIEKEEDIFTGDVGYVQVSYQKNTLDINQGDPLSFGDDCLVNDRLIPDGLSIRMYQSQDRIDDLSCEAQSSVATCTSGEFNMPSKFGYFYCNDKPKGGCDFNGAYVYPDTSTTTYSRTEVHPNDSCDSYATERHCREGTLSGSDSFKYDSCIVGDYGDTCTIDDWVLRHTESVTAYSHKEGSVEFCETNSLVRECTDGYLDGSDVYQYRVCEQPYSSLQ